MRRQDRAVSERSAIEAIIQRCEVDDGQPYVVPLFFGYEAGRLYAHSAHSGRKLDVIRRHPRVCVTFDVLLGLERAASPCAWSARYQSAIGFGTARIVTEVSEKQHALALIMAHYGAEASFSPEETETVTVLCVEFDEITGKQRV